jgi:chromosome segregation ATPase
MLNSKRRVNKGKFLKNASLEEKKVIIDNYNLSIANLKIEEEKMIKRCNELSQSVSEKNSKISNYRKEKQEIKDSYSKEISILKSEVKELNKFFNSLYLKLETLNKVILKREEIEKDLLNSIIELQEKKEIIESYVINITEQQNKEQTDSNYRLAETLKALSQSQGQLIELKKEIELTKEELEGIKERCVTENKVLSRRQKDLGIYEKRLRNKYPDEIINI